MHALANHYIQDGQDGDPVIYEALLTGWSNPIQVRDPGTPDSRAWLLKLEQAGKIDANERMAVRACLDDVSPEKMGMPDLQARLCFKDYMWARFRCNVLCYENEQEGVGDISICALDPAKILVLRRAMTATSHLVEVWKSVDRRMPLVHPTRTHLVPPSPNVRAHMSTVKTLLLTPDLNEKIDS